MKNKTVLNELSLIPNLGIKPSFSSKPGTSVDATGGSSPEIAQKAKALTDQIQLLTAKITASKQQAMKSTQPDQQKIMQYMSQLNQLQSQLAQSEENNEEKIASKILKAAGRIGGAAIGGATKIPGAAAAGAKLGEYNISKLSEFLGIEDEEITNNKNLQKRQGTALNNNTSLNMKNKNAKKKVEESLAGTVGDVAGGALRTVGTVAGAIPLVGGALKAGADLAAGGVENVLGTNENEEAHNNELTDVQNNAVNALEKRRYRTNKVSYQFAKEEGGPTVYMSKKPNKYTTLYAEVDAQGNVNGDTLEDFLGHAEENEEKVLTKSQQRIAKMAPPYDKITGADFAAMKAHKENVDILNFLKSISQKNYAQADKYLGSLVNEKIKKTISRAVDKTK